MRLLCELQSRNPSQIDDSEKIMSQSVDEKNGFGFLTPANTQLAQASVSHLRVETLDRALALFVDLFARVLLHAFA